MRRKQAKRKIKASNININKVKVAPNIINKIVIGKAIASKSRPKPASTQRVFSLGYINTTPTGELLELSKRISNLEINRMKEQQKTDGIAVGVSGYLQAEQQNKPEPLPPLESMYSSPQISIAQQEQKLKTPPSVFGSSNSQMRYQSGVKLEQVANLFKQEYEKRTPTPKKNLLKEELNKQYIREEVARRVSQRESKPPQRYSPSQQSRGGARFTFTKK